MVLDLKKISKCKIEDIDPDKPKSDQVWCVYSEDGSKLLGRHATRDEAVQQLRAIEANKNNIQLEGDEMADSELY